MVGLEVPQFSQVLSSLPDTPAEFQKLRWLGFPLTLHCFALFNHNQVSLFCSVQSGLPSDDLCDAVASQNANHGSYTVVEWREAAER